MERYKTWWMRDWLNSSEATIKEMESRIKGRRKGSDSTVHVYMVGIRDYLRSIDLEYEPDKAVELMREDKIDPTETIDNWIGVLIKRVSSGTAKKYIQGVKRWLQSSKVNVQWGKIEKPIVEKEEIDRAPTIEELRTLLDYVYKTRDETIILCSVSSGLRIGTLLSLKWSELDFNSFEDVVVVIVKAAPGRKLRGNRMFITFFSPEAREKLLQYKGECEAEGSLSPYVFPAPKNHEKHLSPFTFRMQWIRVLKRADLDKKAEGGKWYNLHLHTLRKWFMTRCIIAEVPASFYQIWMGHKGGKTLETYLNDAYFKPILQEHVKKYRKVIPHLTLKTVTVKQQENLQKEVFELRKELDEYKRILEELKKNYQISPRPEFWIKLAEKILPTEAAKEFLENIEKWRKKEWETEESS